VRNIAHLREDSPFYMLFERGEVPIKNIIMPNQAVCEGDGDQPQDVYMVDLDCLTAEQMDALVRAVRDRCGHNTPLAIVRKEIMARGLPLRRKHVASVSTDVPFFL
jgi:hypothetical protein